ncbi:beta-glucosidase [Salegentibacter agarivorans]|uniref:Beta-glucosidase n=1 Tax=Salegentibacter agarivorans TaxID=345907 RepID=A0A1I2KL55_9FLAO|nr:glycoside hydrolase family 3 C-terminal domain-containing protein [Salegentibacter agarivorans]SFF67742.1 beta-glucosidase [Salegentibacter agarivorans]
MKYIIKAIALVCLFLINKPGVSQEADFAFLDEELPLDERVELLVSQMNLDEKISQLTNSAPAIPRLKVPEYNWWNEALHGVARNGKSTIFPQAIGLAATFDTDLAHRVASAISTEARAKYKLSQQMGNRGKYAGLTFWTPNVNIFRDPRWGRGQETYGEDPYLTSKMGVAFVRGLQGDNEHYLKTGACAKHFAVHSGPEKSRHTFNAEPSLQDLHETYLPAFKALVLDAKVEGVMTAYNAVLGVPSSASSFLIQDILRDEWNFNGYITSDCGAIGGMSYKMKYVDTPEKAAAEALRAGVNLNCGSTYSRLKEALELGLINEDLIDERIKQLFKTRFRLGMFDDATKNPYSHLGAENIHDQRHIALAKEAAQKSIVLLKNKNNILPLKKDIKTPYLTGPFANSNDMLMGSYYGVSPGMVTILEGVTNVVSPGTSLNYRSGALPFHKNINSKNWAPNVAAESDVTICVVGLTADREGEEVDAIAAENVGDKVDLKLPKNQVDYVKQIIENKKGPLVLVIASGSPVSLEGLEEYCDAILQIWYPGEQGGNAVADVIFGNISPSGHLPITFPKSVEQLPPYEDYSMQGRTYKYMTEDPEYSFGFGLTYSDTNFKNLVVNRNTLKKDDSLEINIEVSNSGDYDIEEVVQVYISPINNTENLPLKSLKAFQRINLDKGKTSKLSFTLNPEDLKYFNKKGEKAWIKGQYNITVGNSSPGELSHKLGAATPEEILIRLK